ncbi:ABC transporter permease [Mariniblastus fucicola]|uniref:ABC-2 family transporter protein n=1 Tax=Mariniblastus fucicola TaxID=980251 RepID=A0A5B9PHX3_9BACT|nr:ABC transporter permease [Mariniblastus fucicola]QEG25219.1 ABC-2 family transporter protein [Mariniblastus fucicola]
MRPYLAIIKDSFRAALASKVLYVLLGLIVLFLLLVAPLHVRESLDTHINLDRDVRASNQAQLVYQIKEGVENDNKGMQRIWEMLSQEVKNKVDNATPDENADSDRKVTDVDRIFAAQSVVGELNDLIEDPEFFRDQDWDSKKLGSEARGYLEKDVASLTEKQKQRLNRVLISESFGGMVRKGAKSSLDFYYGPFDWSGALSNLFMTNLSQDQFASQISSTITRFLDKVVLSIGLLIAILVTANVVPQTFEPGTLNLLLSKPVSRMGLFLAKFVGGCMFIALCAMLLFAGLWLWMGLGLGIWERAVLISIPLYIVVFAIYYSVSAFTGLVTRSTILAIVATGLFWAVCWSVGMLYLFFSAQTEAFEITKIVSTDQGVLQTDPGFEPKTWDDETGDWVETKAPELDEEEKIQRMVFRYMGDSVPFPDPLGPVFVEGTNQTAFSRVLVGDPKTHRKQQFFVSGDDGEFIRKGNLPSGIIAMFATKENIICINRRGRFYRYDPDMTFENGETSGETWFVSIAPEERVEVQDQSLVAVNHESEEIAIYQAGKLDVFEVDSDDEEKKYKLRKSAQIETGTREGMTCHVAFQGSTILLALGNGQVILIDAATLEKKNEYLPESRVAIESVSGSPDGRWYSLLYKDETLRLVDTEKDRVEKPSVRGQGSISAVHFGAGEMFVADRTDRVTGYDLKDMTRKETKSPTGTWMQRTWRYGIKPLYFAFPKPGEFYKVVTHLSSSSDAQHNPDIDLTFQEVRPNPWSPLISGLVFMAVMLTISCLTFSRTDY